MRIQGLHILDRATETIAVMLAVIAFPIVSLASRPFVTEDAGVAGNGIVQFEMSWDYMQWRNTDLESDFMFVPIIGISDEVELSFEAPFLSHSHANGHRHRGLGDLNVVTKFLLARESERIPAFVLKTVVKTTTASIKTDFGSGAIDYGVAAVASKEIDDLTLHGMFGYTFIGKNGDANLRDVVSYGLAADYSMWTDIHLVAELVGNTNPDRSAEYQPASTMVGTTLAISNHIVVDASTRFGLTSVLPDWSASLGLTVNL